MYYRYLVIRVNRDPADVYAFLADRDIADVLDTVVLPDAGDVIEFRYVSARDAGAARLLRPAKWLRIYLGAA